MMKKLAVIIPLIFALSRVFAAPPLLVTEVAPDETKGTDWIEIYVNQDGYDINGVTLKIADYSTTSDIITFSTAPWPDGFGTSALPRGAHIVVNLARPELEYPRAPTRGAAGVYYAVGTPFTRASAGSPYGISGSEGLVYLAAPVGAYIDVVAFNDGGAPNSRVASIYETMASSGQWSPAGGGANPDNYVRFRQKEGTSEAGASFARKRNFNGSPRDTDRASDWEKVYSQSPGGGYNILDEAMKAVLVVKEPNPFSPKAYDASLKSASISYEVEGTNLAYKTIRIYNVAGRMVRSLMESDRFAENKGTLAWDGSDESGRTLPTGVYVVWFRAVDYGVSPVRTTIARDIIAIGSQQ